MDEKVFVDLLNYGSFKFTQHIPKDRFGNPDYCHPDSIEMIEYVIKISKEEARILNQIAHDAEVELNRVKELAIRNVLRS